MYACRLGLPQWHQSFSASSNMLKGIEGVSVFQDNVLVFAPDRVTHDAILKEVLSRFQTNGVVLRRDKCVFMAKEVEYLGHLVNDNGILPKTSLVDSVVKSKAPSDKASLKSFLGLCEFNSSKLRPLSQMLTKGVSFEWSSECQGVFEWVKQQLVSPKVLKHYDPSLTCTLTVDASNVGLGAALSQKKGGRSGPLDLPPGSCLLQK